MLKIYVMLCSFIDGVLKNWSNQQKRYPKREICLGQSKLIIQIYSMSMMDMVKICWYLLDFLFPLLSASEKSKCDPISHRKKPPRQLQYKWNTGMVQISSRNMDYSRNVKISATCSLQTPRLPASDPAYRLTCSNPCVGLAFLLSKT